MRGDALAAGRPVGVFLEDVSPVVCRQSAASCQGRLAAWRQAAGHQDAEGQLAESPQVALLPDLRPQAFRPPHHFQVELGADWQSVARDVCWATATRLA
jgi:hypothetical protein